MLKVSISEMISFKLTLYLNFSPKYVSNTIKA